MNELESISMKRNLTFLLLLISSFHLNAQIVTSPAVDVPTMIANIFGVQCQGVSNVQVTGAQSQIARFENGQYLGVHSGLVLSTGYTINIGNANTETNSGIDTNSPGSSMITSYGGDVSYNAISIDFDFAPTVTDTIRFNYIFASEEYPEYSNTQYTDRFLFLVSDNTTGFVNVAIVPGTTTQVEINTINQDVNSQFYISNESGPNSSTFMFDGYTVPLQAKFFAQVGNSYHIHLVIADVGDGIFDSAIFLDEQQSYNTISGNLTVNGTPGEGTIEVFNYIEDAVVADPVETTTVTNGSYNIDSLPTGLYHVRFTPDTALFPNAAPLYFATGSTWMDADAIGLPCYLDDADLDADTLDVSDSGSSITGNIIIDTSFLKSLSVPFEGALILLKSKTTNETKGFTYSDANGKYVFSDVGAGDYYIVLDVPYIPHTDTAFFDVEVNEDLEDVDYSILTTGITCNCVIHPLDPTSSEIEWSMGPNPTGQFVTITTETELKSIKVFSVNGSLLKEYPTNGVQTTIDVNILAQGVYIVQPGDAKPKRLIISK